MYYEGTSVCLAASEVKQDAHLGKAQEPVVRAGGAVRHCVRSEAGLAGNPMKSRRGGKGAQHRVWEQ